MMLSPHAAGVVVVKVGTGTDPVLESLGITKDGVMITNQAFFQDIYADGNGGDQGPPIEVQYLGEIARIRLELVSWDDAVATKLRGRLLGATEGVPGYAGTFMFGDSKTVRVVLSCLNGPMNFPRCFLRKEWEINKGTRYSTLVLEFEAHKDATGVLYNAAVT